MRKLMMTSALVVPFLAGPAFAQDAPAAGTEEPVQQNQAAPAGEAAEGEPVEVQVIEEPAEGEAETAEQPPADPATETAEQPPAEPPAGGATEPETAEQPQPPAEPAPETAEQPPAEGEEADVEVVEEPAPEGEEADVEVVEEPAPEGEEADVEVVEEPAAEGEMAEEGAAVAPEAVVTEQGPSELRGDWVIGTGVVSPEGETIGNIEDIILDAEQGQVTAAILSVGGFLGLGAKNIAVDWSELQIDYDGQEITMDLTREEAEQAPEYAFRDQAEAPAPAAPAGGDPAMAPAAPPAQPSQ